MNSGSLESSSRWLDSESCLLLVVVLRRLLLPVGRVPAVVSVR